MPISKIQNFYKEKIVRDFGLGTVKIYLTTAPDVDNGFLLISPSNEETRELVRYTSKGTDNDGEFVNVNAIDRGIGRTTEQVHRLDESVIMPVTSEHIQELSDAIDQLVLTGTAPYATQNAFGLVRVSTTSFNRLADVRLFSDGEDFIIVTYNNHGLAMGTPIRFGVDSGSLPSGISADTTYYVGSGTQDVNHFSIAATPGGPDYHVPDEYIVSDIVLYAQVPVAVSAGDTEKILSASDRAALTPGGDYGTLGADNPVVTKEAGHSESVFIPPVVRTYTDPTGGTNYGSSTTRFDIKDQGNDVFRYEYDNTGTSPNINDTRYPVGAAVVIVSDNMSNANQGVFKIVGSGTNYFDVTNTDGVAENNKTLGDEGLLRVVAVDDIDSWTKPDNLKYIEVQVQGGGGRGGNTGQVHLSAGGGGSGGYAKKLIAASDLGATELLYVGSAALSSIFRNSINVILAKAGKNASSLAGGTGGDASGGDINIPGAIGQGGGRGTNSSPRTYPQGGNGASSPLGNGGGGADAQTSGSDGNDGTGYGAGGGGGLDDPGGDGTPGIIIITEHYI